ncbi:MAG: pilus assembly protein [Gammaproteobacteria bacterium]
MLTKILATVTTVAVTLLLGMSVRADDTDIYLNPNVPSGAEPLVMFSLDYRPNLTSTAAAGAEQFFVDQGMGADVALLKSISGGNFVFFDVLILSLKLVLSDVKGVKIGLMFNHNDASAPIGYQGETPPNNQKGSNGGLILRGFESLDAASLQEFLDKLIALKTLKPLSNSPDHPYQGAELFYEFFRYLTGQKVYNGHNGWIDFEAGKSVDNTTNMRCTDADANINPACWDMGIETPNPVPPGNPASKPPLYLSPLNGISDCTKIFTINFLFQVSAQEGDSTIFTTPKGNGGLGVVAPSSQNDYFPGVLSYLRDADLADGSFGTVAAMDGKQNVTSYFIVDPTKINITTTGYANAGGTGAPLPLAQDPQVLIDALKNIFKSILSVSTTFVAPSVPVNVFNRAQIADELFMAVFQADENGKPFWPGNLKKLAIVKNAITGKTELQDVNKINAIDIDGRIKREALTFWTDPATLTTPAPTDDFVAGADGREVKRGGAGQKIPGLMSGNPGVANSAAGARQLFTEGGSGALIPLNADAATATDVWPELTAKWLPPPLLPPTPWTNSGEQEKAINLLGWARGFEMPVPVTDPMPMSPPKRNWFMADPLHSRPRPINYGARGSYTATNQDVRILMGTNDGIVHMFTNIKPDGSHDGSEAWGFLPREALPLLDRLSTNGAGTPIHPISSDGAPSVLIDDTDLDGTIEAGEKVWAFFGMRRGGKSYYALDITDPDNPQFMWKITKGDPGFEELGQTWSVPQIGKLDYTGDATYNPEDVIVFAGGYNGDDEGDNLLDLGKDAANRNGTAGADDDEGNAIYIVEAKTGNLIWKASRWTTPPVVAADGFDGSNTFGVSAMKDSIPSDVTAVDLTGDGLLDRIYVGDLGGVVWRADIAGDDISQWKVGQLLSVGRHDTASGGVDRRFFNAPDVALSKDQDGAFDAVLIGSGDREDPLDKNMEDNFFYMIKDRNTTSGTPPVGSLYHDDLADLTIDCVTAGNCSAATNALLYNGWTLQLGASGSGEKNLAPALTLGGIVFFTTFEPKSAASACDLNEGTGYLYAVNLQDATPAFNFDTTNDSSGVTNERRDQLESGGIPVQPVPISGDQIIIQGQASPNNIMDVDTATSWKTFWYDLFN